MANENLIISAAGLAALRQREGIVLRHYNDVANNCTCPSSNMTRLLASHSISAPVEHGEHWKPQIAEQTQRL